MKLFWFFARKGATETGADRVDEDEVGDIQQGIFILDEMVWGRQDVDVVHVNAFWPQQPQMQPNG